MFFLADTSQKVDDVCFAYSCIYSVQFKVRRKFSYFAPSDNRERPETRLINGLLPMHPRFQSNIPSVGWYQIACILQIWSAPVGFEDLIEPIRNYEIFE